MSSPLGGVATPCKSCGYPVKQYSGFHWHRGYCWPCGDVRYDLFYKEHCSYSLTFYWDTAHKRKAFRAVIRNDQEDGLYEIWFPNGQKMVRASFKNGRLDGRYYEWNQEGRIAVKAHFKDGATIAFHETPSASHQFLDSLGPYQSS